MNGLQANQQPQSLQPDTSTARIALKTYTLYLPSIWLTKARMEVRNAFGQTFLWRNRKSQGVFKSPVLEFHTQGPDGPVVAAARIENSGRRFTYVLGDPDAAVGLDGAWYEVVKMRGFTGKAYDVPFPDGTAMTWKRTHDKELGASKWGNRDFKLVNAADEVVAVHVNTQKWFKGKMKEFGRLEWFVELGEQNELAAMAVLMTIFEEIQREENAAAASGGA